MKKVLLLIVSLLFSALLVAQDDAEAGWKKGGQGAFNFSQTALSNWSGGGESALSLNTFLSMFANYQKEKLSWDNDLDLAYGLLRQEKETRKTDDRIELSSKFGYRLAEHWSYSSVLGFKTQMMPGYDSVLVSSFAAPAYLQISTGAEYKAGDHFSLLLAPLSGKMTLVADTALSGNYGLDPGKKLRAEFGGFVRIAFRQELVENVSLQTKCELFSNYIDSPHFIDVSWDVLISMKINEYLNASVSTQLLYDHDYSSRIQFKETVGLGLSFTF